jgi:hypothetical protein
VDGRLWWKEAVVYQIYPQSFQDTTGSETGDLLIANYDAKTLNNTRLLLYERRAYVSVLVAGM